MDEQQIEVISARDVPVGQVPPSRDYGSRVADEWLYGALPESERAWRLTVARIDAGYMELVKTLGTRAPKNPFWSKLRTAVLREWRAYKVWSNNATSAPRGMLSQDVMRELGPWKKRYAKARKAVVAAAGTTTAPTPQQATVKPGAPPVMPGPSFVSDLKTTVVMVAIVGSVAWLWFGNKK